jgi:hypothetical protein
LPWPAPALGSASLRLDRTAFCQLGPGSTEATRVAVSPTKSARLRTSSMNEARCYAQAGAGRPSAPLEGGLPREKKARPALLRAPRPEGGSGGLAAASAARTTREVAPGDEIATGSDPQVPLDPADTGSSRAPAAEASEPSQPAPALAAGRATAKRGTRASNTSPAAENSRLGFGLPDRRPRPEAPVVRCGSRRGKSQAYDGKASG